MPHRNRVLGSALLLLSVAACAPTPPPPVCGRTEVLDRLDQMLREAGRPMRLLGPPVGEVSTAMGPVEPSPIVHCAINAQVLAYDTNRYGTQPINEIFSVQYSLELRRNGIFIQLQ